MIFIHVRDLAHSNIECNASHSDSVVAWMQDKSGYACRCLQSKGLLVIKIGSIILKQCLKKSWASNQWVYNIILNILTTKGEGLLAKLVHQELNRSSGWAPLTSTQLQEITQPASEQKNQLFQFIMYKHSKKEILNIYAKI